MRPNLNSVAVGRAVSSRLPHSLACAAKRTRALSSDIKVGRHALCGPRSNRTRAMSCGFWFLQLNRAANGRYGSSTEMLRLSISRLLFSTKADADRASAGCTVGQGPRSHAARNAAFIGNDEPCHASEQRDRLVRVGSWVSRNRRELEGIYAAAAAGLTPAIWTHQRGLPLPFVGHTGGKAP